MPKRGFALDDIGVMNGIDRNRGRICNGGQIGGTADAFQLTFFFEPVDDGEPVVVLNTVKASIEMVSEASGHTFHLLKVGDRVVVGDILGVVADNRAEFLEYKKHNLNNVV